MAGKLMIEKSEELLHEFFKQLSEAERKKIGLMGGWAVHYILKNKNIEHIGSRDIDIFFNPKTIKPSIIEEKLKALGFHPHSTFRWVKLYHSETEKELNIEESKKHPLHNLSYIYFDIATPSKIKHSMPEPLLKKVFKNESQLIKVKGQQIMVPTAKIMIEMKLKSSIQRTDGFKRTKDIADLYSLLNAHSELWQTKNAQRTKTRRISKKSIQNFKQKLERFKIDGTITTAANMINTSQERITQLLEKI
jgi:hypothetical protein